MKKKSREEDKDAKIDTSIKELKETHEANNMCTPMQYRVWAETLISGMATLDCAPTSTMFNRAGGGPKKHSSNAMEHIGSSPAKVIDNPTKCYKQLADLKNLLQTDVLSKEEYDKEKATIMGMLQKLQ